MRRYTLTRPTGRKDWVDFAKGVAILLVILYHSELFLRSMNLPVFGMGRVKSGLEMLPMPAFLFIAGLYHFRVVDWTLRQTWSRRLFGYLYLYLLWSLLRFGFYFLVPNVRADGAGALATDPAALLTLIVWPINSYWFLLALLVFTAVLWAVRRAPRAVPIAVATLLSVVFGAGWATTMNVGWDRMAEYLVFFLIGAAFQRRLFDAVGASRLAIVLGAGAVWAAMAVVAGFVPGGARMPGVVIVGEAAAVWFLATASVRLARLRPLGWVSYLGARSLHLYLLHVFVIAALCAIAAQIPALRTLPGHGALLVAAMMLLVITISLVIARVLDRFSWFYVPPKWLQRLAGAAPRKPRIARTATPIESTIET